MSDAAAMRDGSVARPTRGYAGTPARPAAEGATPSPVAVEIVGLVKSFGSHRVFDGLGLRVARGERLALLGASGCGKSTLLRCIAGLERPDAGHIAVTGEIGFVFQEPRLFPWLSVEDNVAFAARTPAEHERVGKLIRLVGLREARGKLPKALSGGMAQRAALARALVRDPGLILLDEPLAALDALLRLELRAALGEIVAASGATSILVTHDVDEALGFAQRCIVLERRPGAVRAGDPVMSADPGARAAVFTALGVDLSLERPSRGNLPSSP